MCRIRCSLILLAFLLAACGVGDNQPGNAAEPESHEPTSAVVWLRVGDMTKVDGVT